MEKELTIKVVFDTGEAKRRTEEYAEGSIGMLKTKANEAYAELKKMAQGTAEATEQLKKAQTYMQQYNDAIGKGQKIVIGFTGSSANAAMTMQALNYTIRDSPYFFRDFSLGLLAIGNNLNPLIDGLIRMKGEAKDGQTVFGMLKMQLSGAGGLIFFFSVLVTVIQAVTFAMAKNKSQSNESKKSYEDLSESIQNYTSTIQDAEKAEDGLLKKRKEIALQEINDAERKLFWKYPAAGQPGFAETSTGKQYERERKLLEESKKALDNYVTDPNVDTYIQKQTEIIKIAETYSGKSLPKILELNGVNKNLLDSTIKSLQLQLDKTDLLDKNYGEMGQTIKRLKDAYDILFPKEKKDKNEKIDFLSSQEFLDNEDKIREELSKRAKDYFKNEEDYQKLLNDLKIKSIEDEYDQKKAKILATYEFERQQILENTFLSTSQTNELLDLLDIGKDIDLKRLGNKEEGDALKKRKKDAEIERDLQEVINREIQKGSRIANELGDSLVQAFMNGKNAGEALLVTLEAMILKMFVAYALEQLLFAGLGLFTSVSAPTFNPANTLPGVSNMPTIPFNISTITPTINYSSSEITRRLDSMNMNMATQQPIVFIQADTDAIRFTKKRINPAQHNLSRGNIINVS